MGSLQRLSEADDYLQWREQTVRRWNIFRPQLESAQRRGIVEHVTWEPWPVRPAPPEAALARMRSDDADDDLTLP